MRHSPPVRLAFAVALVVPITLVHFATDVHWVELHNVYRRLYYIPIVLGAFAAGSRGGLGVSALAVIGYLPHAFFSEHPDPAPALDKLLEMVLYVAIGAITGWLVEQQNKAQDELRGSLDARDLLETQLVRAGKLSALGELSAGLAHEIRNPLASILGAAESLTADFGPEHRKHRVGQLLIREVHRLNGVVTRFVSFARPQTIQRTRLDVMELAREVRDLTAAQAKVRGISVTASDDKIFLEVDGEQVTQVLLNVLLNAYDAAAAQENPVVRVESRSHRVGEQRYVCIVVIDNGPGVSSDDLGKVFDPFFTGRDDGTGLGLSISARIMAAHEGLIDLVREGVETEAWLCFPENQ